MEFSRLNITNGPIEKTSYDNNLNIADIYLNIQCDGNNELDLNVGATIIHEFIHAEIFMTLFNLGLDPDNLESFDEAWDNYQLDYFLNIKELHNLNDIHHAIMVFIEGESAIPGGGAVDRIATMLWQMNNENLTPEHYYHLAWDGLRYIDSQ